MNGDISRMKSAFNEGAVLDWRNPDSVSCRPVHDLHVTIIMCSVYHMMVT